MKKFLSVLLTACMVFSITACGKTDKKTDNTPDNATSEVSTTTVADNKPADDGNLIPGGDFSEKDSHWGTYTESGGVGDFSIGSKHLNLDVTAPGTKSHSVQVYCDGFELLQNTKYKFSFDVSSSEVRTFEWRVQINGGDYHAYAGESEIEIGPEEKSISFEFTMNEGSDPAPRLCFNFGFDKSHPNLDSHTIAIANVRLEIIDSSGAIEIDNDTGEKEINVNQIGFRTDDDKKAVFATAGKDDTFEIIDLATNEVVYEGKVTGEYKSYDAGQVVSYADFSDFKTAGEYRIRAKNSGESYSFKISDDVYSDVFNGVIKMLYYQRCGCELTSEHAGDFAHKACHTGKATIYGTDTVIDVSGGWHDAGDYGRYIVPASKAVADLLLAYEMNPSAFSDSVGIPESGNGIADVLDEARYELEWMFKMQNEEGGVYHKVTGLNFEGQIKPDEDDTDLYVMPVSNWDTADFAAVMALASRIYKSVDKEFSDKCIAASKKAMDYHIAHRGERGFKNPSDVSTGEYPDGSSKDEYIWMLSEYYKTTQDKDVAALIDEFDLTSIKSSGLGWATVDLYAYYAYLTSENLNETTKANMTAKFKETIDKAITNINKDAYDSSLYLNYPWGSNMTIANNGELFLMASKMFNDDSYVDLAKTQLDYLLGNNSLSYSFVTCYGEHSPKNPHHRPTLSYGKTVPGMLVGGPDSNLEDPFAKTVLAGLPAAKCYRDNSQTYSCNEVTIYWNSPMVFLLAAFQ